MHRIFVIGLAALTLLPVADRALAQEEEWMRFPYRVALTLEGGIGMPLKPSAFNDQWNASFPVSLGLGFVVVPQVELKGWFTYAGWGISEIPAKDAIGIAGVTEITGGSITTLFFGGAAKIIPFPNSRIMPYIELGGGYFQASGDDLTVDREEQGVYPPLTLTNSMDDASGPAFMGAFGMEYGFNESWNVFAEADYYIGFSDSFAPGDLVRGPDDPEVEGGDVHIAALVLGIVLKL